MPPIDWSTLLSSAPNIVTAVVFGFFVLKLLERQDLQNDKRDDEWRLFLSEGRDQYIDSITSVTDEIKILANTVTNTHQLLVTHDNSWKNEIVREGEERANTIIVAAAAVKTAADAAAEAVKAAAVIAESARMSAQVASQVATQVTAQMAASALEKVNTRP